MGSATSHHHHALSSAVHLHKPHGDACLFERNLNKGLDCSKHTTQDTCDAHTFCAWQDSACNVNPSTRALVGGVLPMLGSAGAVSTDAKFNEKYLHGPMPPDVLFEERFWAGTPAYLKTVMEQYTKKCGVEASAAKKNCTLSSKGLSRILGLPVEWLMGEGFLATDPVPQDQIDMISDMLPVAVPVAESLLQALKHVKADPTNNAIRVDCTGLTGRNPDSALYSLTVSESPLIIDNISSIDDIDTCMSNILDISSKEDVAVKVYEDNRCSTPAKKLDAEHPVHLGVQVSYAGAPQPYTACSGEVMRVPAPQPSVKYDGGKGGVEAEEKAKR